MPVLDSFTPPTDSVYKFMALSGIVLFLGFLIIFWKLISSLSNKLWAAKLRGNVLKKRLELMIGWNKTGNAAQIDPLRARDEAIEVACLQEEHAVKVSELEEAQWYLSTALWIFPLLLLWSVRLSVKGFYLWQTCIQNQQDVLLYAQAREEVQKLGLDASIDLVANLRSPGTFSSSLLDALNLSWPWMLVTAAITIGGIVSLYKTWCKEHS
jgi:hypothetical protein